MFGLEHIFCNCHGEWGFIGSLLVSVPLIGGFLKAWLSRRHKHKEEEQWPTP